MENNKKESIYSELTFTKEQIRLALEQAEGIIEKSVFSKYPVTEESRKERHRKIIIAYEIAFTKALFGTDDSTIKN